MRCCWGLWMYIVCNVTGCGISQQNGRTLLPESGLWPVVFLRLFDMGWTGRSDVLIKWLQWCTPCRSILCCISSFLALDDFSTSGIGLMRLLSRTRWAFVSVNLLEWWAQEDFLNLTDPIHLRSLENWNVSTDSEGSTGQWSKRVFLFASLIMKTSLCWSCSCFSKE